MTSILVEILQWAMLLAGSFFLVVGAFGVARMPDIFTRMHAASVADTLGAGLLILGMCLESGFSLVTVKLLMILALFFFTSPLSSHALARAALVVGVKPLLAGEGGRLERRAVEVLPPRPAGHLWEIDETEGEGRAAVKRRLDEQDIGSGDSGTLGLGQDGKERPE
ncbi:monovalent cation/H(+) antiporter subunit G [Lutibaculum baratangense]|uniref:Monovalent cation/proton antiporter, MnhG/PhaG family n=1 Tax=Lutibaculum baratangense AMV1 TaxID=631454 RepID=V4T827_9HYPH|nr:monovalent cation/H(+) antiporter subunit G [Lutibaculum baratangense]ESR22753.1 monovalent cation/proton antiporter, MnhG/PhaG family [Lutibaculum baratangense AMV1]